MSTGRELPPGLGPDLTGVQEAYDRALSTLLGRWEELEVEQVRAILDGVLAVVAAGDPLGLQGLSVQSAPSALVLEQTMIALADEAAAGVVAEASEQGLDDGALMPGHADRFATAGFAQVVAGLAAGFLISSAIGETLRVWGRGRSPGDVRDDVGAHLDSLTDAYPRLVLGGALSKAQRDGRVNTIMGGPVGALFADEILDKNTCDRCAAINRKWLGNVDAAMPPKDYPVAGYVKCRGRWRCRGQVVAVWRGGDRWQDWMELPPQRTGP